MKLSQLALTLILSAALPGIAAQAGEHRKDSQEAGRPARGMQAVVVSSAPGEPGHGWRYFSDKRKAHAVVISPGGDYYYSRGDGLRLVYRVGTTA